VHGCDLPVTRASWSSRSFRARRRNPGLDKYHVHVRCFAAGRFERRRDGTSPHHRTRSPSSSAPRTIPDVRQ